ncbi:phage integrase family protein [Mycolicibacterium sp. P1-18]|uniref:phage integrase family protein n=1 Tax=Mycolicibacterium sp. P1-18 TaxID=2024615 RepID=UPI0011F21F3C|nr:phage integrase family protein [Mycolicibacterium sp. P1-18]
MRIKRLIVELAAVPRPESILTWMRNADTANLLAQVGARELQLSHAAFDALPPSRNVEHLREMLVHHRMMPSRGDPIMVRFEAWVDQRLKSLVNTPVIHAPIEQYARWHHLRRLREPSQRPRNMANATGFAKQQITEATKFLRWLLDEHGTAVDDLRQDQIDSYLSEGPTTRAAVRNFVRWRAAAGIAGRFETRYRTAAHTPLMTSARRLALIKTMIEADHIVPSARIAGLILLLYGVPVSRIAELTVDDIEAGADGTSIKVGALAAPIPRALLPLLHDYLNARKRGTMNHGCRWLFPGLNAGQHTTEQTLMQQLRGLGIDIKAARNGALHDLIKEIDPASLADLLGYTANTLNIHAARAAVPMATYPAIGALRSGSPASNSSKYLAVEPISPPNPR